MSDLTSLELPAWAVRRVLAFLNRAQRAEDFAQLSDLLPAEEGGTRDNGIGEVVGNRILERRSSLPAGQFSDLEELQGIPGLGAEKFRELIEGSKLPADEAFRRRMYKRLIGENFVLTYESLIVPEAEDFLQIAASPERVTQLVASRLQPVVVERTQNELAARLALDLLGRSYVERYESGHLGAHAFALWFYRLDQDNWFSFEAVLRETMEYLDYFPYVDQRSELLLYKGFPNAGLLAQAITASDLPVVLNYAEQRISFWSVDLYD
jgi:hypothetical protein